MKITAAKFDGTDYLVEIDDAYGQNLCRDDLEIARMVLGDILDKRKIGVGVREIVRQSETYFTIKTLKRMFAGGVENVDRKSSQIDCV